MTRRPSAPRLPVAARQPVAWRLATVLLAVGWLACALPGSVDARQQAVSRESSLKAVFIFKFINYIQWPPQKFARPDSPVIIATLGDSHVNSPLSAIAQNRMAGMRQVAFRRVRSAEEAESCHILFVPKGTDQETVKTILTKLKGQGILLVGEDEQFLQAGGVISMLVLNNKIRLAISRENATNQGIKLSAQLIKLSI